MNEKNLKSVMSIVNKIAQSNKTKTATDKSKEPAYPEIIGSWDNTPDNDKIAGYVKMAEEQIQEETDEEVIDKQKNTLEALAAHLRAMQFLYHNFHHLVSGPSFFSDHGFFGDSYSEIESNYDSVVENMIGDGSTPDLKELTHNSAKIMLGFYSQDGFFNSALIAENSLQSLIESISKGDIDQGTTNLIGGIAEMSKTRTYKIKQRISK